MRPGSAVLKLPKRSVSHEGGEPIVKAAPGETICNALIVQPRFHGGSFWAYKDSCQLVGARYPAPSLGLITVAAMLPESWDIRLIDRNVVEDEAAFDAVLDWSDLVLTGGMMAQQRDLFAVIDRAQARGVPVAVGGPDVSSSPHLYERADLRVLGEAEGCIDEFIAAWEAGQRKGTFTAPLYSVDVTRSPVPRFDLLDFSKYLEITVQFSRGCPFRCEFCDIIELYGRNPRTKTSAQMLAELDRLYELGYRGTIEFSDDNLIGNKKAVKAFLPHLVAWQKEHGYPFDFVTEASLNLADDQELLDLLREANFFALFVGIESPDPDVLVMAQKKQNTRREIAGSVHKIQAVGIIVVAGFIIGFDNEKPGTARGLIDLIEDASIPISMISLLYALPNTQLTKRLAKEGRLHADHDKIGDDRKTDQCTAGLNFDTLRPRHEVLGDFRTVVDHIYRPEAYFDRVRRTVDLLDCSGVNGALHPTTMGRELIFFARFLWNLTVRHPAVRGPVWRLVADILWRKPRALKAAVSMAGMYVHLGPFSRTVVAEIDRQIAEVLPAPAAVAEPGMRRAAAAHRAQLA